MLSFSIYGCCSSYPYADLVLFMCTRHILRFTTDIYMCLCICLFFLQLSVYVICTKYMDYIHTLCLEVIRIT